MNPLEDLSSLVPLSHVGQAGRVGVVLINLSKNFEGRNMKFGTIGAGAVALAFAREALARGHEVVLSSRRGPESLASKAAELGRGGTCQRL